ncbi:hypothetical protein WJF91_005183, partial [Klebsiella pneumoniae]
FAVPKFYHQHYLAEIQHPLSYFYHINKQQFLKQNDSARTLFFPLVCRCLSRSGIQLREVQGANTQKGAILLVL